MTTKERLKQYIEKDEIYQNYKQNKLMNSNDFDKFCIQHCKDIEELLEENQELKKQLENKYKKVGTLTSELLYEENTKLINQQKEFVNYLKDESKEVYRDGGLRQNIFRQILQKYKEIIEE